ncbi:hypothetical protein D3H55_09980 [Bacillus salacetis]|uniref:Uncharacterized protein n=1 Tax=Bacillus salacetis TaxID=2315464 RepID=A0A3A1QZG0_9BACI|nr:hypothetical protein D3H55_09980 [Bacillus salacetis]
MIGFFHGFYGLFGSRLIFQEKLFIALKHLLTLFVQFIHLVDDLCRVPGIDCLSKRRKSSFRLIVLNLDFSGHLIDPFLLNTKINFIKHL